MQQEEDPALTLACGALCLELQSVPPAALRGPVFAADGLCPDSDRVVTWLVEGGRFLVLAQTPRGTRVYDPASDFLYYASPRAQLAPACPPGHAFLCQTVCDAADAPPRLLVTDLVAPPIECPRRRNEALRALAHALPTPLCLLQWAGDRAALERFIASGGVPHRVAGLVALRGPLVLARERPARPVSAAAACVAELLHHEPPASPPPSGRKRRR